MSNEDLQQLKVLADKIKSGDYSIDECNKFIDVSGPDAILALIERIESLAAPAVANGAAELPPLPALPWQTKENRGDLAAWLEARSDTEIAEAFGNYGEACAKAAIAASTRQAAPNIEAVARAICTACEENPDHQGDAQGNAFRWQDYEAAACAAIAASAPNALLVAALKDITQDYAERFDLESPSTNPGIKHVVEQARSALASAPAAPQV